MKRFYVFFLGVLFNVLIVYPGFTQKYETGLVKEFLVLGGFPFKTDADQPLLTDYLNGETEVMPALNSATAGKKWQSAAAPKGMLDFKSAGQQFGDYVVGYAHVYLKMPVQKQVKFLVGSDDGIAVFVNGVLMHENHVYRGVSYDTDVFPVVLAAGWNRVLCKVFNGQGGYQLAMRILNLDDSPINDLEMSADNPISPPTDFVTPAIPAEYDFRSLEMAPTLSLESKGTLNASITGLIFNLGNQPAEQLTLAIHGREIKESRTTHPTQSLKRSFEAPIDFIQLMKNSFEDSLVKIELNWDSKNVNEKNLRMTVRNVVDLVFNPIDMPVEFNQTSTKVYAKTSLELPKLFKKAPLAIIHPFADAEVRANGKLLEPIKRLPADFPFIDWGIFQLKGFPKKLKLEVTYSREKTAGQLFPARLIVYEPKYHLLKQALEMAQIYEQDFISTDQFPFQEILTLIDQGDWDAISPIFTRYDNEVVNFAKSLQQNKIHFIGNAHIDLAWLWPWTETVEVCRETFENAIQLMEANPDFTYAQSQAQAYEWIEKYYPELFAKIQENVKSGKWIIVNGMWTEPDSNLPSGEAFVRQILYGHLYFKEKFGVETDVAWTPDTFGYAWTLPQIYRKSGFKYFVTNKIWWNDVTRPQHHLFWWEAPDGTRILTFLPKGYSNYPTVENTLNLLKEYQENTRQSDFMILYGHGDHGGGPTKEMVSTIADFSEKKLFPKVTFSTPNAFFDAIEAASSTLPVLRDEMYLEYHRGCYTTQAKTKKYNRQLECLLETAEKFATLAEMPYPKEKLADAWKRTLFNQFHDILPGSSIPIVYQHALASYDTAKTEAEAVLQQAISAISEKVHTIGMGTPVIIFNPLSWEREGYIEVELPQELWNKNLRVIDGERWIMNSQIINRKKALIELVQPSSTPVPAVGYKTYHLQTGLTREPKQVAQASKWKLKNKFFEITFDEKTGNIHSIKDLQQKREVLAGPGNELQFFEDIPAQYDAWNIGYTGKEWRCTKPAKLELIEKGPLRAVIRVTRTFQDSRFVQEVTIYRNLPTIEFHNHVDWHESHVLVKAAFPLTVKNDRATFEIPYGWIERPTVPKTAADSAKFEVSAHKWIDLTDATGEYGVSLLNDCKYGFDIKGSTMRITLLRSPKNPDPEADMGEHTFVYALYPHKGDWQTARTHQLAYELNYPLIGHMTQRHVGQLSNTGSLVKFEGEPNIVLTTLKPAERRESLIIRLVEYYGKSGQISLTFPRRIRSAREVDLVEKSLPGQVAFSNSTLNVSLKPFEIKSIEIQL